jgi:hypothetical protein
MVATLLGQRAPVGQGLRLTRWLPVCTRLQTGRRRLGATIGAPARAAPRRYQGRAQSLAGFPEAQGRKAQGAAHPRPPMAFQKAYRRVNTLLDRGCGEIARKDRYALRASPCQPRVAAARSNSAIEVILLPCNPATALLMEATVMSGAPCPGLPPGAQPFCDSMSTGKTIRKHLGRRHSRDACGEEGRPSNKRRRDVAGGGALGALRES